MEERLIIELWDTFKEYIPEKSREMAASQYVSFLVGEELTADDLEGFLGYDSHLDVAINIIIDEEKDNDNDSEYAEDDEAD